MNILCFLGIHKWNKSPEIVQHHIITDKYCDAVFNCERCAVTKTVTYNCYTGQVYKTFSSREGN